MFHRSERLLLRPAWPEDWQAVHAAIADEGIVRNLATAPWPYSAADARAWCALPFTPEAPRFVITLADSGEVIGCIGIGPLPPEEGGGDGTMELGYWIARPHWGRGYAGEAARAMVERLAREPWLPNLAISLHATNDDLRNEIVPINRKYNLKELFEAIRAYPGLGNSRRVTFEYVMLKGVNDSLAEARDLVRLLRGVPAKINLIPFNPWPGSPYECSDWDTIEEFAEVLNQAGYASPIRTPRGRDILAACGQLRSESVKKSAAEKRREALEAAAE